MAANDVTAVSSPPGWRRWIEPWFLSYAILGAAAAGLAPILLPLSVLNSGSVADIGFVIGAFNLGGLSAPLWGGIADRRGFHRLLLLGGLLATALALAVFPFVTSLSIRLSLAFLQGTGAASAATVANLFIVEMHPQQEWDERIGWLQTFYGVGQVVGLLLAGVVGGSDLKPGFLIAGGITLVACFPAMLMKGNPRTLPFTRPVLKKPSHHAGFSAGSPQSFYHHLTRTVFDHAVQTLRSPLGIFLVAWLISFGGVAAFFSLYPVLMKNVYSVDPSLSSVGFAIAATIGLFVYAPAGHWSHRYGPIRVLRFGMGIRVIAFAVLIVVGMLDFGGRGLLALLSFLLVVVAWSLLSVTGTELTARFSEGHEGEGLGLFNASTAVAGVLGAVIGGWSAQTWGYEIVPVLGIVGVVAGIVLTGVVSRKQVEN